MFGASGLQIRMSIEVWSLFCFLEKLLYLHAVNFLQTVTLKPTDNDRSIFTGAEYPPRPDHVKMVRHPFACHRYLHLSLNPQDSY